MLKKVRGQKSQHANAIKQLEKAQKEVKNLIGRLEEKRTTDRTVFDGEFAKLKGNMIWPVEGRCCASLGKSRTQVRHGDVQQRNRYRRPLRLSIRAVASGTVEFVDWIDAYGSA